MISKTKKLTQGAMIAAMFGVLSLMNTYTASAFDIFILYMMVIPIVYYGYHYSIKENVVVCVASIIVILLTGVPSFVVSALFSCMEGLYIGECLKQNANKRIILFGVMILAIVNNVLLYQVLASFLGINISQEMTATYQTMSNTIGDVITLEQVLSIIPLVILITGILEGYVIVMICSLTLKRFHIDFPHNYHLASMHFSSSMGIVLMVMMIVGLYGYRNSNIVYYQYMFLISMLLLSLQGLSFVLFHCVCRNVSKGIQILAIVLIFVPIVIYVYAILGLSDIFLDLRGNYGK